MKKTLVVLENDMTLDGLPSSFLEIIEEYDGDVVLLTNLKHRDSYEIAQNFILATDIICYSMLVNGSEYQLISIAKILSTIKTPINIFLKFHKSVKEELTTKLTGKILVKINHHNIFEIGHCGEKTKVDLSDAIVDEVEKLNYTLSAKKRVLGKAKILSCNASGSEFNALPIGEVVDVLDMSKLDKSPNRGIWVWGLTEPVKLLNENGMHEYEIVVTDNADIVSSVLQTVTFDKNALNEEKLKLITYLINDPELSNLSKAHDICDILDIPRRMNRQNLNNLLNRFVLSK